MKKIKTRMGNWLTKTLELPSEVTLELPRITMIGSIHAYIENHQGLMTFKTNELRLKVHHGYVKIVGSDFVLKMMIEQEILLEGNIEDVSFQIENGKKISEGK
ncbi:sporulation protein YqfC [Gracilibacillus sp. YIM 98692]|uniref:sporulation protein YqfC n=1 Tax=Gracilibacillus sp. YIM 98692 TaxID=2663532 RepID=UPI0013D0DBEB|nr:sporulation protein YqfC [Gracilibacillus sp. YIM 98692]